MFAFSGAMLMIVITIVVEETIFAVLGCVGFAVLSCFSLRLYPLDPRVWFATLGGLYAFSYPIQTVLGIESGQLDAKAAAISAIFFLSVLGAMWLSAGVTSTPLKKRPNQRVAHSSAIKIVVLPLVLLAGSYVVVDSTLINLVGVSSKRDLWEISVGLPFSGFMAHVLLLTGACWILAVKEKSSAFLVALFVGMVAVYAWSSTGERDVLLKWVLMATFAWVARQWISVKLVVILGLCMVVVSPIMKDLGLIFGGSAIEFQRTQRLHHYVLGGEWASAGSNLEIILRNPALYEGLQLERFVADFARGFAPSGLFHGINTSSWYTEFYTPQVTGRDIPGIGFSLVAAMWIYGGVAGVISGGLIYGLVSWWLFRLSGKGALYMAAYFLYIPLSLWSIRGDMSFWLSAIFKQVFFPSLALMIVAWFLLAVSGGDQRVRPLRSR